MSELRLVAPDDAQRDIGDLDMPLRAYNTLRRNGIDTIEELYERSEEDLLEFVHFGVTSLRDVCHALHKEGLPPLKRGKRCPHCGGAL
jgi:DNA-directed RNA polymerase alpha subunit